MQNSLNAQINVNLSLDATKHIKTGKQSAKRAFLIHHQKVRLKFKINDYEVKYGNII